MMPWMVTKALKFLPLPPQKPGSLASAGSRALDTCPGDGEELLHRRNP